MTIARRILGATGLAVSVLGYGGAPLGFAPGVSEEQRAATYLPLLQQALDLGINFFDTAPDYRQSEELLGQAVRGRREQVVLASKAGRVQHRVGQDWQVEEDWSETGVQQMIEGSLRRLDTSYLDLVQLHSPPAWVLEQGAALRGLQAAQRAGLVRHIGVSIDNEDAWLALDLGAFATLQTSYSLLQQEAGAKLLPAAAARGLGLIIKQPVANGIADLPERPAHPDWSWKWDVAQRLPWQDWPPHERKTDLALRWVVANPLISTAIVGTTNPAHLAANVALAGQPLAEETRQQIEAAYYAALRQIAEEQSSC